jgi:hypothetical protein
MLWYSLQGFELQLCSTVLALMRLRLCLHAQLAIPIVAGTSCWHGMPHVTVSVHVFVVVTSTVCVYCELSG